MKKKIIMALTMMIAVTTLAISTTSCILKKKPAREEVSTTLSPPWIIYANKVEAIFTLDKTTEVSFNEKEMNLTLKVKGTNKADAIEKLLGDKKEFGNVTVDIEVIKIPENDSITDGKTLVEQAFLNNPAFVEIVKTTEPEYTYAGFAYSIAQVYADDLSNPYGDLMITWADLADEILVNKDVHFCYTVPYNR